MACCSCVLDLEDLLEGNLTRESDMSDSEFVSVVTSAEEYASLWSPKADGSNPSKANLRLLSRTPPLAFSVAICCAVLPSAF